MYVSNKGQNLASQYKMYWYIVCTLEHTLEFTLEHAFKWLLMAVSHTSHLNLASFPQFKSETITI